MQTPEYYEVRLKIQNFTDRKNIISALANSGYAVRVEEGKECLYSEKTYWVNFSLEAADISGLIKSLGKRE